jgi:hypothetical protein
MVITQPCENTSIGSTYNYLLIIPSRVHHLIPNGFSPRRTAEYNNQSQLQMQEDSSKGVEISQS